MEPYTYYLSIMGLLLFFVGVLLLKRPRTLSRIYLSISLLLISLFIILTAIELLVDEYVLMIWLRNLQQISLYLIPIILFGYAMELNKHNSQKTIIYTCLLAIPPIITLLLIYTDHLHGWMRTSITVDEIWSLSELSILPTRLSMVLSAYPTFLALFTILLLMRNMNDIPVYNRWNHIFSAIAIFIPVFFIMFFSFIPYSIPGEMALSFTMMAILLIIVNKRYDLNSVWPFSSKQILESLDEGILLFDSNNRLIEINQSGSCFVQHIFGRNIAKEQLMGKNVSEIFRNEEEVILPVCQREHKRFEWHYHSSYFKINIVPTGNENNGMQLVVVTDLTEMKLIEKKLYHLAHYDELTNISNRRSFMERYKNIVSADNFFTFLLLDVDYFKQFNDNYGHLTGDHVLRKLALLLNEYFANQSAHAIVGRIGGEEFAVLIDKCRDDSIQIAKGFQKLLAEQPIQLSNCKEERITVSIGITSSKIGEILPFEKAYHEADIALYQAKAGGRDHIEVYQIKEPIS
ncbi:sensor domain-containing diguanylate cyclase [Gracilibacillus xinjiangensis]|uniref:Diguanylate cyclase domain-containing protein n=1 Tax=Gracilibacillus xinjiangensis TaxID=1193282 RepID=A0ABV8WYR1_9BACI